MSPIAHIGPAELEQLCREGKATVLDVRTDAEVARGIIEGAVHIPLNLLPSRYAELDPAGVMVIYCQSGGRSAQACAWLADKGFERVYNLQGGTIAWVRDGRTLLPPA